MKFFTCSPLFPGKDHLVLMVSLAPYFGIQPQPSPPPSPSCLTDLCHLGRSLLTGNCQISHLYQKVATPNLFQIIAPYRCYHFHQNSWTYYLQPAFIHLLTNSLLSNSQFGFHPCSFTQEALIAATTSWHQYLDEKQSVVAVFFDLSKAFDSVPHLDILRALTQIGVTGSLHTWFAT